jgi:hypothetical protein
MTMKVGDKLIANAYCGFPDGTTKCKSYTVSKVEEYTDREMFYIINDEGKETFPISTVFVKEESQ